ncbi:MAG: hypothetical protein JWP51_2899 [Bradyrhizobium sp.]|nr:hypothetical protein [Bradyrhizobium sp.]
MVVLTAAEAVHTVPAISGIVLIKRYRLPSKQGEVAS